MHTTVKGWIEQHPLTAYFVAAYAISWSIAVPLALQAHGLLRYRLPWTLHDLTAFGPAAAALLVTRPTRKPTEARRKSGTSSAGWWFAGFGAPLLLFVIARIAARVAGQAVPAWSSLGHINYLPDLGLAAWGLMTWAFVLEDIGHDSTRLIVRARGGPGYRFHELPWWAAKHIVTMIHLYRSHDQDRARCC
jgi:hypothetical protein